VALLLLGPGCLPELDLSSRCTDDSDCYAGERCERLQGQCLPVDGVPGPDLGSRDAEPRPDQGDPDVAADVSRTDALSDLSQDSTVDAEADAGPELCNGADDDGDGATDEDLTPPAGLCSQQGVCAGSTPVCGGAEGWQCPLPPTHEPEPEQSCDGLDNDCNGAVDDVPGGCDCQHGQLQACGEDRGICRPGEQECVQGEWAGQSSSGAQT